MMGPSICLMSICMFAAIRCPLQEVEEKNQSQQQSKQVYPEKTLAKGQPQFQNVDDNKYVNGKQLQPINHKRHGLDI